MKGFRIINLSQNKHPLKTEIIETFKQQTGPITVLSALCFRPLENGIPP
ncbi:hypothetical protein OAF09_00220 [bacterium]|nr:hypothetical protein [bacterium]